MDTGGSDLFRDPIFYFLALSWLSGDLCQLYWQCSKDMQRPPGALWRGKIVFLLPLPGLITRCSAFQVILEASSLMSGDTVRLSSCCGDVNVIKYSKDLELCKIL